MDEKWIHRFTIEALRYSLAVVFIWFGALKLFNVSPVDELISAVYPIITANYVLYLLLALLEIGIGLGIMVPRISAIAGWVMIGHLLIVMFGTFFTGQAFSRTGVPALSLYGEFVLKNIVLISAAFVIIYHDKRVFKPAE